MRRCVFHRESEGDTHILHTVAVRTLTDQEGGARGGSEGSNTGLK